MDSTREGEDSRLDVGAKVPRLNTCGTSSPRLCTPLANQLDQLVELCGTRLDKVRTLHTGLHLSVSKLDMKKATLRSEGLGLNGSFLELI